MADQSQEKSTIILVGPIPPPIGGVSVHVSRLAKLLQLEYNVKVIDSSRKIRCILSIKKELIINLTSIRNKPIIHNHVANINFCVLLVTLCRLFKIKHDYTFHSFRQESHNPNYFKNHFYRYVIKHSRHIICVSEEIREKILELIPQSGSKLVVLEAYIPFQSSSKETKMAIKQLKLEDFLHKHKFVILANAFKLVFHQGDDLYGLDLCVELMKDLKSKSFSEVGFIFMLPQIGNIDYYQSIKTRIQQYQLDDDFLLINQQVEMTPLFGIANLFVRPTNSDGDSVSIREALQAGLTVLASDIVKRPEGVRLFSSRNLINFSNNVQEIIKNDLGKSKMDNDLPTDNTKLLIKYRNFYNWI